MKVDIHTIFPGPPIELNHSVPKIEHKPKADLSKVLIGSVLCILVGLAVYHAFMKEED